MLLPDDPARAFMPYPPVEVPGAASGPLAGLSFAAKDLFDVAGYPTGGGSPAVLARSGIKQRTAPAVQRLLDAGARFVGKTHTDEFAYSIEGRNAHFGTPLNGAAPDRLPGGSSSGSASAVSAGLCDVALGTDTAGSVRVPASHCGLFGLRPTHGRVPLEDCMPLAPSFDTAGFLARTARTFARVAGPLLGEDPAPLPATPRLLLVADAFALLGADARAALAPALARVEQGFGPADTVDVAGDAGFSPLRGALRVLQGREAWIADGAVIETHRAPLGPGVDARFAAARAVADGEVAAAGTERAQFRARLLRLLGADGVLILPTVADVAPLLAERDEGALDLYRQRSLDLLCLASLAGAPQVTMPLASRLGAPLGVSLMGPPGCDLGLVGLALRIGEGAPV